MLRGPQRVGAGREQLRDLGVVDALATAEARATVDPVRAGIAAQHAE